MPTDNFINLQQACRIAGGVSPVTLWREERAGHFPKRRKITARRVGWLESEIREWIKSRANQAEEA